MSLAFTNWSGSQSCHPRQWILPRSEAELAEVVRSATGVIRAVGAGHSFSPLVPTNDTLIGLDEFAGIVGIDESLRRVTCRSGTRIRDLGQPLADHGLALAN